MTLDESPSRQPAPDESLSRQPTLVTDCTTSSPSDRKPVGIGKQDYKRTFPCTEFFVLLGSVACLCASIAVVVPRVAWRLGFDNQIVLIGFFLAIMNLCLNKLTPTTLALIEARSRWCSSILQNYDAILRNTLWTTDIGLWWQMPRIAMFGFLLLPLGLSVGYKRFTGGTSTISRSNTFHGRYGLAAPPLGDYTTMKNSVYYTISANVPFLSASSDDSTLSPNITTAYGYNTLLLDSTSAALLDMPLPDYVVSIQQSLQGSDYWKVSAVVNATVARYNASIETYRQKNDPFFNSTLNASTSAGDAGFTTFCSFDAFALGWLPSIPTITDGSYVLVGYYYWEPLFWDVYIFNASDPQFIAFQETALMFNIRRERCAGTWQINRTAVVLLEGSCSGILTNQGPVSSEIPFFLDALPVLNYALLPYAGHRNGSSWRMPAFATGVATSYWARWLYMLPNLELADPWDSELNYPATEEHIEATKATLDAKWGLYVIFAVQPTLALLMFLFILLSYGTPIGGGFGMVAIMSAIDKGSLDLLSGAALSGELGRPVKLDISVENETPDPEKQPPEPGRIRYTIIDPTSKDTRQKGTGRLQRKRDYK